MHPAGKRHQWRIGVARNLQTRRLKMSPSKDPQVDSEGTDALPQGYRIKGREVYHGQDKALVPGRLAPALWCSQTFKNCSSQRTI
jgi:hypothetical protein